MRKHVEVQVLSRAPYLSQVYCRGVKMNKRISWILAVCLVLMVGCQKQAFEAANVAAPKDQPPYTVKADLNSSPAGK